MKLLRSQRTVSAPGKLLLAGGYLVLENPNIGVVIAVDKRFHCTIHAYDDNDDSLSSVIDIQVNSPQFGQTWKYIYDKTSQWLERTDEGSANAFVEKTLRVGLLALLDNEQQHQNLCQINLTIQGDNDFYSLIPHLQERGQTKSLSAALALPRFLKAPQVDGRVLKTGLGSSACLVTSLVAALWYTLRTTNKDNASDDDVDMIFRLAQICHCHCQGKVGSGFDVAAACYGTHVYERFPKALLADLLTQLDDASAVTREVQTCIRSILKSTSWQGGIREPLYLPSFVQVMLADVSGGSESPSMARTVLAWKKGFADARVPHWDDLVQINQTIAKILHDLSSMKMDEAQKESLIKTKQVNWKNLEVGNVLLELRAAVQESRRHLKAMGEAAGVPIEPDEQTALVDATLEIPGVIAALVPGAGGYDAIACLYVNHPTVQHAVADFWCAWTQASVCPLTVQSANPGEGLRLETTEGDAC